MVSFVSCRGPYCTSFFFFFIYMRLAHTGIPIAAHDRVNRVFNRWRKNHSPRFPLFV